MLPIVTCPSWLSTRLQVMVSPNDEAALESRLKDVRRELAVLSNSNVYHHSMAPAGRFVSFHVLTGWPRILC
jgi:hypothetical protein